MDLASLGHPETTHLCAVSRPLMDAIERMLNRASEACDQGDLDTVLLCIEQGRVWLCREGSIPKEDADLWACLANRLAFAWVLPEQRQALLRLLWIHPWDSAVHSDLVHCLHYQPDLSPEVLAEHHLRWAEAHARPGPRSGHANDRTPDRRLRIGYVSADLRAHCVAFFLEPLLLHHDRTAVELVGYDHVPPLHRDPVTERLVGLFDLHRCLWGADDACAAEQIRADRIDLLVDLGGHTHHHRLGVFAQRPAPVQVTYLGYPDTTGLAQMDYRLTDALADAPGSDRFYTERLVRLDCCFACYGPPAYAPAVSPLPATATGRITFGSFVGAAKYNGVMLNLWADVLKANPTADLLLRFDGADTPQIRHRSRQAFARLGIDPVRIRLDGWRSPAHHLAAYAQVDVALDSFPWNSHTTLCEALWMGVPVVSLTGRSFVSRTGLSVLSRVGLEDLAATSADQYVARATALARDRAALGALREGLRPRMQASDVCNARGHTRSMEQAFRAMWRTWCETAPVGLDHA